MKFSFNVELYFALYRFKFRIIFEGINSYGKYCKIRYSSM